MTGQLAHSWSVPHPDTNNTSTMLTSSSAHSQYLHPDYLQPLPTTLDAKKSPLALLAQTCSSIGKDTTPSKSLIPPLEKSGKDGSSSSSSSSSSSRNARNSPHTKSDSPGAGDSKSRSKSPGENKSRDDKNTSSSSSSSSNRDGCTSPGSDSSKSSFRAPAPKEIPPLVPISAHSPSSGGSSRKAASPEPSSGSSSSKDRERERDREKDNHSSGSAHNGQSSSSTGRSSAGLNSRISLSCGNMLLEVNHQESAQAAALHKSITSSSSSSLPTSASIASSMLKPLDGLSGHPSMLHPGFGAYAGCLPLGLSGHPALDAHTAASMHHSAAALSAHSAMSAAAKHSHAALSPYTYARVKTTSGATTLVPICRDPYCTNCQITMQQSALSSAGTCAAGCTQCSHEKGLQGATPLPPSSVASALGPALSGLGASASSLYPHAFGVLPGHHSMPYVCNWVAGSDYCGKRFSTSEELLQHLRTHTASSETAASLAAMQAAYGAGLTGLSMQSHLAAAGCPSHFPTPGSLSPNSLRQAYGRSLSPNTLLAASRYHPYAKSPLSGLPSAPASLQSLQGAPSLGAYYSPYALYGQRLGAAVP